MTAPVAVFAVGNRSRGDDAAGPLLLERLRGWLDAEGLAGDFELFEAYQLQVENALDLEGRRLALFIDACRATPGPLAFCPVRACGIAAGGSTHALAPGSVLGVYRRVTGEAPPPAFQLGVRATDFELGSPVSAGTREAMEEAWRLLRELARAPRHSEWQTMSAVACAPRAPPA
ncbi:MAG: hydrogenase maturation protease [Burkholderiales bacterium]